MSDYNSGAGSLDWKWVFISMGIFFVSQIIVSVAFGIFGILTFGIGLVLFIILKPVSFFIGGYITGRLSPGITIREPALGAVIVTLVGAFFDSSGYLGLRLIWVLVAAVVAYAAALIGARIGEGVE